MKKYAFTLIEIIATVALISLISFPFMRMILMGKRSVISSEKMLIIANLVREKAEELSVIYFNNIKSDFDNYANSFRDIFDPEFRGIDKDAKLFYKKFTDIWTGEYAEKHQKAFEAFKKQYKRIYGRDYILYPNSFKEFRRIIMVEREISKNKRVRKKVKILIYLRGKDDKPIYKLTVFFTE